MCLVIKWNVSMETILITGSAGFIGFHASLKFLGEGWKVIGFDALTNYYDVSLKNSRNKILNEISNQNYFCQVGGCSELYLEKPIIKKIGKKTFKNAEISSRNSISFIVDNTLLKKDVKRYSDIINKVLSKHLII